MNIHLFLQKSVEMRTRDLDKVQLVKEKAMELVVDDGLEKFSVNKLAKACNISVATLYIYYKDKEDLILQVALEEGRRMTEMTMKNFDPEMRFEEGLRLQWKNRAKYMLEHPSAMLFFEQLRSSSYHEKIMKSYIGAFKENMGKFLQNAIDRGEINKMQPEVYWAMAYGPLYTLLRFHHEGTSFGGRKFVLNKTLISQTFDLVIKALKP